MERGTYLREALFCFIFWPNGMGVNWGELPPQLTPMRLPKAWILILGNMVLSGVPEFNPCPRHAC